MKTRKTITLPSGGTCVVRKLAQSDYIASGQMPLFLKIQRGKVPAKSEETSEEDFVKLCDSLGQLVKVKLTRCCGTITNKDGTKSKIVDKPNIDDLGDGEVSIEELDQTDAQAICAEVDILSGLTKEAVQTAATFPEGSADGSSVSSAGEQLRGSSDRLTEPQPS